MKWSGLLVLLAVVAVLATAMALDPLFHVGQNGYLAGLVATFAGVLAGVPLALLIDRIRQTQEEAARVADAAQARSVAEAAEIQRVRDVLGLVRNELGADEALIAVRSNTPWEIRPHSWDPTSGTRSPPRVRP